MHRLTQLPASWAAPIGGIAYQTQVAAIWEVAYRGSGWVVNIPRGFCFDVSIPRWARWALSPHDPAFLPAAALHDHILRSGWDRVRAAAEFNLALQSCGVGRARRLAMFAAVAIYKWR